MSGGVINVCFDRAAQHSHQNRIDADDRRAEEIAQAEADIGAELTALFLIGLGGEDVRLPIVTTGAMGRQFERAYPLRDAVMDCLDFEAENAILMRAFRESTCPVMRELRVACAARYVASHARDLAVLRCTQ